VSAGRARARPDAGRLGRVQRGSQSAIPARPRPRPPARRAPGDSIRVPLPSRRCSRRALPLLARIARGARASGIRRGACARLRSPSFVRSPGFVRGSGFVRAVPAPRARLRRGTRRRRRCDREVQRHPTLVPRRAARVQRVCQPRRGTALAALEVDCRPALGALRGRAGAS
jgi:hypothetical protein